MKANQQPFAIAGLTVQGECSEASNWEGVQVSQNLHGHFSVMHQESTSKVLIRNGSPRCSFGHLGCRLHHNHNNVDVLSACQPV